MAISAQAEVKGLLFTKEGRRWILTIVLGTVYGLALFFFVGLAQAFHSFLGYIIVGLLVSKLGDTLCYRHIRSPEDIPSVPLTFPQRVFCFGFAFLVLVMTVPAAFSSKYADKVMGLPGRFFVEHVSLSLIAALWFVYLPVMSTAANLDRRIWPRHVWALGACLLGLVLLYLTGRGFDLKP